jgi:virginiamycin B lyase
VAPKSGQVSVRQAPRGRGPYGICATPAGDIWWCSLAGSFIARIDRATGDSEIVEPPTRNQGARRIWSDRRGRLWVSEWSGNAVFRFDPRNQQFERFAFPRESANVRQILGRRGEVWLPESGTEHISVIRTA